MVTLIRDLRGDEALGEAMDQMVALVHHAYLAWDAGLILVPLTDEATEAMLSEPAAGDARGGRPAEGLLRPAAGAAGLGQRRGGRAGRAAGRLLREPRARMPTSACSPSSGSGPTAPASARWRWRGRGPAGWPAPTARALFAPALPGGRAAGLRSITGEEELLELGWRHAPGLAAAAAGAA